jgi:hypothetical protein
LGREKGTRLPSGLTEEHSVEAIGIETGRRSADPDQMSEDPLEFVWILNDGRSLQFGRAELPAVARALNCTSSSAPYFGHTIRSTSVDDRQ